MINTSIVFTAPWEVEVRTEQFDAGALLPDQVIVKKRYSLISPGTELACLSGNESWFRQPGIPGYAAVSEIVAKGEAVSDYRIGDIIFHYGNHAKFQTIEPEGVFIKVPGHMDLQRIPFTRMATVDFTAIRVSAIELGDCIAVTGQGLVGNMAAQLARLQGASVIAIDLSENRLKTAKACGADYTINSNDEEVRKRIWQITAGQGVSSLVEATGAPRVAEESLS